MGMLVVMTPSPNQVKTDKPLALISDNLSSQQTKVVVPELWLKLELTSMLSFTSNPITASVIGLLPICKPIQTGTAVPPTIHSILFLVFHNTHILMLLTNVSQEESV